MDTSLRALVACFGVGLATGCGPGTFDPGTGEPSVPSVVAEHQTRSCDTLEGVLALDEGGFIAVGETAVIHGWAARFDGDLELVWETNADVPLRDVERASDGSLWAAGGGWGIAPTLQRLDASGNEFAPVESPDLPPHAEISALARRGATWLVAGRSGGEFPFDAWLVELDSTGAMVFEYEVPTGSGNVSAGIGNVDVDEDMAIACGVASGGEWGWPHLVLSSAPGVQETLEGSVPDLGVSACLDVALSQGQFAWSESGEAHQVSVRTRDGDVLWSREFPEPIRALTYDSAGRLLAASDQTLHALDGSGEASWSLELDVPDLRVREVLELDDGAILVAGTTPGDVGECGETWLGLVR